MFGVLLGLSDAKNAWVRLGLVGLYSDSCSSAALCPIHGASHLLHLRLQDVTKEGGFLQCRWEDNQFSQRRWATQMSTVSKFQHLRHGRSWKMGEGILKGGTVCTEDTWYIYIYLFIYTHNIYIYTYILICYINIYICIHWLYCKIGKQNLTVSPTDWNL